MMNHLLQNRIFTMPSGWSVWYPLDMRLILLVLLLFSPVYAEQVCSVHDGDTFKTCSGSSIRVWGIDAPELKQPMGYQSRDFARNLLMGREVDLECSGKSYQRRVCSVFIWVSRDRKLSLASELVGWGLAYDSPRYSKGKYSDAEAFAQSLKRGVWVVPDGGVRPWDWRKMAR